MSKDYVLLKIDTCWADEFDVEGFTVSTKEKWDEINEKLKDNFPCDQEFYFGTNEFITFDSYEDWKSGIKVIPITEDEAKDIRRLFGSGYAQRLDQVTYAFGDMILRPAEYAEDED